MIGVNTKVSIVPVLVHSCSAALLCDIFWWPQIIKNYPEEHFVLRVSWNVRRDFNSWEQVMYLLIRELRNREVPYTLIEGRKTGYIIELRLYILLLFCCVELCGWSYFYITLIQTEWRRWHLACSSVIHVTD